jgi:hypothetical protein
MLFLLACTCGGGGLDDKLDDNISMLSRIAPLTGYGLVPYPIVYTRQCLLDSGTLKK